MDVNKKSLPKVTISIFVVVIALISVWFILTELLRLEESPIIPAQPQENGRTLPPREGPFEPLINENGFIINPIEIGKKYKFFIENQGYDAWGRENKLIYCEPVE